MRTHRLRSRHCGCLRAGRAGIGPAPADPRGIWQAMRRQQSAHRQLRRGAVRHAGEHEHAQRSRDRPALDRQA